MYRHMKIVGLLVIALLAIGLFTAGAFSADLVPSIYLPLVMGGGGGDPISFTLECDQDFEINFVGEEAHFQFSATAFEDGNPLEDVELKGTLDTGSGTPFNLEKTNVNGVADFTITVLVPTITETPVATVTFEDQATFGNASCSIDFSGHSNYALVCDQDFEVRIVDEEVHFEFSATALENGIPLSNVELVGTVDTGGSQPSNVEETNVNGVADFRITALLITINQTPVATVAFFEPQIYGSASCTIDFSSAGDEINWASMITDRSERVQ